MLRDISGVWIYCPHVFPFRLMVADCPFKLVLMDYNFSVVGIGLMAVHV